MSKCVKELFPVLEIGSKKLDVKNLKRALLDNYGRGTALWDNFNFFDCSEKFDEKLETQKYNLDIEITLCNHRNCSFVLGQGGCFLKAYKNIEFSEVNNILSLYSNFLDIVKAYMFIPIGVAHYSDGDFYLRNGFDEASAKRAGVTIELFENEEVKHEEK